MLNSHNYENLDYKYLKLRIRGNIAWAMLVFSVDYTSVNYVK